PSPVFVSGSGALAVSASCLTSAAGSGALAAGLWMRRDAFIASWWRAILALKRSATASGELPDGSRGGVTMTGVRPSARARIFSAYRSSGVISVPRDVVDDLDHAG